MNESNSGNPEPSQNSILMLNLGGMVLALAAIGLVWFLVSWLGIDLSKMSFFLSARTVLILMFIVLALPLGVFGEYWLSRWGRKNRFRWRNVLLIVGVFGLFILVTFFFLTAFDFWFSDLTVIWQLPLTAASGLIGLLVMSISIRNKKFRKWRGEAGW